MSAHPAGGGVASKGLRDNLWWADAALVIKDDVDRFLRVVRNGYQLQVTGADEVVRFLHRLLHPAEQTLPVLAAEEDQREGWNALRLYQSQDLIELIERAEAAGHEDKGDTVFHETDLA
jgi:hypothetical protein